MCRNVKAQLSEVEVELEVPEHLRRTELVQPNYANVLRLVETTSSLCIPDYDCYLRIRHTAHDRAGMLDVVQSLAHIVATREGCTDAPVRSWRMTRPMGITVALDHEALRVTEVAPNSPAALNGVKVADRIVTINGISAQDSKLRASLAGPFPVGTIVSLGLADDRSILVEIDPLR